MATILPSVILCFLIGILSISLAAHPNAPNVILVMMDDLGFSDIGYNGGIYPTKTLNHLAETGITLNHHYAYPICSASRASLLTGRYAYRSGVPDLIYQQTTQHATLDHPFISTVLKQSHYHTALFGKYHLGYSSLNYLPFNRGFDRTLFYESGSSTYTSHQNCETWSLLVNAMDIDVDSDLLNELQSKFANGFCSYDLWNEMYDRIESTVYSEQLFTQNIIQYVEEYDETDPFFIYYAMQTPHWPLEEPPKTYEECDGERKLFCNALLFADEMIDDIVSALKTKHLFDDSLIIFMSDNGPNPNWNSNLHLPLGYGETLPLRGTKGSVLEGGIRTPAFISGGFVNQNCANSGNEYDEMVHISDWFAMIQYLAGSEGDGARDLDGVNLWPRICNGDGRERDEIVHIEMVDSHDIAQGYKASYIRTKQWKLVINPTMSFVEFPTARYWVNYDNSFTIAPPRDVYHDMTQMGLSHLYASECYDDALYDESVSKYDDVMLFAIAEDKIEACNVAGAYPDVVDDLWNRLFAAENIAEYVSYNSDKIELSKQGVLAQIESYDCEYEKAYHVAWQDGNDDGFLSITWNQIFERYVDVVDECKQEHTEPLVVSVCVIYMISIVVFVKFYYCTAKPTQDIRKSSESSPLLGA
eukprot:37529_1